MHPRRFGSHQSHRFVERRKNRVAVIVGLILITLSSWLFAIPRLSDLSVLSINSFEISGVDADIASNIRAAAYQAIDGRYLGIISKANTFLYPRERIISAVSSTSPEIESVGVKYIGGQSLAIDIVERQPAAIICVGLPNVSGTALSYQDDTCYFADATGYIFKLAPSFSGDVYNRYYAPDLIPDVIPNASAIGLYATTSAEFIQLQNVYNEARRAGIVLHALMIKKGGEYELYAQNPTIHKLVSNSTSNYSDVSDNASTSDSDIVVIYMNNVRPLNDELNNLITFWLAMSDRSRVKQPVLFEYINVRSGSNVFYRLAN